MKISAIICDMDGSLVKYPIPPFYSSWDALSLALSDEKKKKWIETRDFYLEKKGDYDGWFNSQLNLLNGVSFSDIEKFLFPIPYSPGVVSFFKNLDGNYLTGILSSGINIVAEKITEELGFDFQMSNYLEVIGGKFTGKGNQDPELGGKKKFLYEIMEKYSLRLKEILFVGDGFGDIPILEVVGIPVAYGKKFDDVTKKAKYIINDFRELEEILDKNK